MMKNKRHFGEIISHDLNEWMIVSESKIILFILEG
jgi:hypothetical protein